MNHLAAHKILYAYQQWRRGEGKYAWSEVPEENKQFPYSPKLVGWAIDFALDALANGAEKRRAILDFCDAFTMVYPPNDLDCPALLAGAFENFKDAMGIETVPANEGRAE